MKLHVICESLLLQITAGSSITVFFQTLGLSYQEQFAFDVPVGHCHADFSLRNRRLKIYLC
jgi:hypothetical protein